MNKADFIPILVGADIGTYSIARSFYEKYQIKSLVLARYKTWMVANSKIIDTKIVNNLDGDNLIAELIKIGKELPNDKKLLIACSEYYLFTIIEHKKELEKYFIIPYINFEQLNNLVYKDKFYQICEELNIPYPKTIIVNKENYQQFKVPYNYPVILKPTDSSMYKHAEFKGKKKIFKLNSLEEIINVLKEAYSSTYTSKFVIQEYIPGDDSNMRVLTCYCNKNSDVIFSAYGQPLLEDKSPGAIGNYVAIVNDQNNEVLTLAKRILKQAKYVGFANFDIKYNKDNNTYYFFEINVRLGRSNFYITGSGYNYTKYLVDEYIYNQKNNKEIIADNKVLYSIVPKYVLNKYVNDKELLKRAKKLKTVNPFIYKEDLNLKKLFYICITRLNHIIKYRKYYRAFYEK